MLSTFLESRLARLIVPRRFREQRPVIPVVRLSGAIAGESSLPLMRGQLSVATVGAALERAFRDYSAPVVALVINSPGGSAVQSHLLYLRIRALAEQHDKQVLAFVEDAAASGGYMIACAADEIFADPSSVIGSIGVISAGFGFPEALSRLGIERRVFAAGEHKGMLDPFRPLDPEDVERVRRLQTRVHQKFVDLVRARRGGKIGEGESDLFTGEFWCGADAVGLGLIDGLGEVRGELRQRFGDKVRIRLVTVEKGFLSRSRPAISENRSIGAGAAAGLFASLEERSLWSRFGL